MVPRSIRITLAVAAAAIAALTLSAPASALTLGPYPGSAPVNLPSSGNGSPYPATLNLGNTWGGISSMTVQVNVSHSFAGDIDLALVSPRGQSMILMSDNCGAQALSGMSFTFNDSAASELPGTATCTSGTFKPSNFASSNPDVFPAPGPASPASTLSAFTGTNPTGTWSLFAVDDASGDSGVINSWNLTFEIATPEILIPEFDTHGIASPYPSTKTFATPPGQVISDVAVKINDFGHESPQDVDVLLADSSGNATVVMSDVCGANPLYDLSWTIRDTGPGVFGTGNGNDCETTEVYPADYLAGTSLRAGAAPYGTMGPADDWPAPAPSPGYGSLAETFGGYPGGPFSLYVVDDNAGGIGYIDDWSLELTTRPKTAMRFANQTVKAKEGRTAWIDVGRDGPTPYGPAAITLAATSAGAKPGKDFRFRPGKVDLDPKLLLLRLGVRITDDGIAEKAEKFRIAITKTEGDARVTGATGFVTVTIAPSKNATLKLGKLRLDARKGKGSVTATVSAPGRIVISGKGVKKATRKMKRAGRATLPIRVTGKSPRTVAKVVYTTLGGRKISRRVQLSLGSGR